MEPIISLILPAYNVAKYIDACLDSCLEQDIPSNCYEIIVVNDGSTDSTLVHLERYASKFAHIHIVNQTNQGLSMARNNGCKVAKGRYIWFIDSDDVITTHCLGNLVQQMEDRNLDMLTAAPSIPYVKEFPKTFDVQQDLSPILIGTDYLLNAAFGPVWGAWCYVIRRSWWQENQFEFYKGIAYEDTQLMPLVISRCRRLSALTTFSCYSYVQRDGSIMHSAPTIPKLMSHAVIANTHLAFAAETTDPRLYELFQHTATNAYIAGLNTLVAMNANRKLQTEFLERIRPKPTHVSADTLPKKIFQYFVLNFPKLYVSLKLIGHKNG